MASHTPYEMSVQPTTHEEALEPQCGGVDFLSDLPDLEMNQDFDMHPSAMPSYDPVHPINLSPQHGILADFDEWQSSRNEVFDLNSSPFISHDDLSSSLPTRASFSRRRLPRRKSKYFVPRTERGSAAIAIPIPALGPSYISPNSFDKMDPMQRWRNSPPDTEPATMSAIHKALEDKSENVSGWSTPANETTNVKRMSAPELSGAFQTFRQHSSRASSDSGLSSSSRVSTTSVKSRSRVRRQAKRAPKPKSDHAQRRFKCTFCCDSFLTKYDWSRHEKSLHLDISEWQCSPHGSMVLSSVTSRIHCAFCNALDPTIAHLEAHNYSICDKPEHPTTFHRKDHLVQHLRLAHHLDTLPIIDDWKVGTTVLSARCGFCDHTLTTWDERTAHLSEHFRQGLTMIDWKGDHNFDSVTASKIRNAIPPYIIGHESLSPVPFTAGDARTLDHLNQISFYIDNVDLNLDDPTINGQSGAVQAATLDEIAEGHAVVKGCSNGYLDLLTKHLSRFAREQMMQGILPTDEMFQVEARKVVYDSESDAWDYTIADNEYWLTSFKQQFEQDTNA